VAIIVYIELSNKQEARLVQQAKELEISQQHRDMVYSIVAHDLRGPFKGLMGITDLLLRQFDDSKNLEEIKHIKAIYNSSKVINNLLDNLLNWAKMQSGNLIIDRKPFNLKNIVDEVIIVLNDLLGAKTITFTNKVEPRLQVVADSNMVSTVLRNVLSNAIKFTSKGGDIGITSKLVNRKVELCIHDTGVGIPADDLKELFNVQTKLSTPGTDNEKGSGLGLVLCKDFIEANGGEIWAESELGRGSKFYFTLQSISN
jgi:signal transduction histidine kinase